MTGDVADVKAGVEAGARIATEQGVYQYRSYC